jgi:hypothetical protein
MKQKNSRAAHINAQNTRISLTKYGFSRRRFTIRFSANAYKQQRQTVTVLVVDMISIVYGSSLSLQFRLLSPKTQYES